PHILIRAVITPSKNRNNRIYTFHVFKAPSLIKIPFTALHNIATPSETLPFDNSNAETTIPVPKESSTLFVIITITIANIGGSKDKIECSIIPPNFAMKLDIKIKKSNDRDL